MRRARLVIDGRRFCGPVVAVLLLSAAAAFLGGGGGGLGGPAAAGGLDADVGAHDLCAPCRLLIPPAGARALPALEAHYTILESRDGEGDELLVAPRRGWLGGGSGSGSGSQTHRLVARPLSGAASAWLAGGAHCVPGALQAKSAVRHKNAAWGVWESFPGDTVDNALGRGHVFLPEEAREVARALLRAAAGAACRGARLTVGGSARALARSARVNFNSLEVRVGPPADDGNSGAADADAYVAALFAGDDAGGAVASADADPAADAAANKAADDVWAVGVVLARVLLGDRGALGNATAVACALGAADLRAWWSSTTASAGSNGGGPETNKRRRLPPALAAAARRCPEGRADWAAALAAPRGGTQHAVADAAALLDAALRYRRTDRATAAQLLRLPFFWRSDGECAPCARPPGLRSTLDALPPLGDFYDTLRAVGKGGNAVTLLVAARAGAGNGSIQKGSRFAVRALNASKYSSQAAFLGSTVRQMRLAARVHCAPHAMRMHDVVQLNGAPAPVWEFFPGETLLAAVERRHVFSTAQARRIIKALLEALAGIHCRGGVYRDVQAGNLMVAGLLPDGRGPSAVRLIDLADVRPAPYPGVAGRTGPLARWWGSAVGLPAVDGSEDVWAAGALASQLLFGWASPLVGNLTQAVCALGLSDFDAYVARAGASITLPYKGEVEAARRAGCGARRTDWETLARRRLRQGGAMSSAALGFLDAVLRYDPRERPSAEELLRHPWFAEG